MKRVLLTVGVLIAGVGLLAGRPPAIAHHIVSSAISAPLTLEQLARAADMVVVVRPTGSDAVHWNSKTNTKWTSDGPARPMIYNDQEVAVVDVLQGRASATFTVRNIGGVIGDTKYEFEGLEPLAKGEVYLLFLETVETPTKEGLQSAVSFVGQDQGVFRSVGSGVFANNLGLIARIDELRL